MSDFRTFSNTNVMDMSIDQGLRGFMLGIYQKMALGLVVTGLVSWIVATTPALANLLYRFEGSEIVGYSLLGYVFLFAPVVLVLISNGLMRNLNVVVIGVFYWVFVVVMGVSLSSVALVYTGSSIATIFFITASAFAALSLFGYTTKINMTAWGSFLIMIVWGVFAIGLVNVFFLHSPMIEVIMSVVGLVVFSGLIAYKTQMLKSLYYQLGGASAQQKAAMTYYGAMTLYISFINLFLSLLRLFGGRR